MDAPPSDQIQSELENFRKEWRAEVSARTKNPSSSASQPPRPSHAQAGPSSSSSSSKLPRRNEHKKSLPSRTHNQLEDEDDYYVQSRTLDEPDPGSGPGRKLEDDGESKDKAKAAAAADKEPQSAIDFYEAAVEKETTGKLGDSLQLYRKAFRMDSRVDQIYKNKHFASAWRAKPPPSSNQNQVNPAAAPSAPDAAEGGPTLSLPDLIASFAETSIQGAPPEVEGMPPPPCPVAELPDEILVHILRDVAVADVGDFVRLARVCKRLAYLVVTEDRIWRRVCLGSEFGFGGMHYNFQQGVSWEPLDLASLPSEADSETDSKPIIFDTSTAAEEATLAAARHRQQQRESETKLLATNALLHSATYRSSWALMFRTRPRVRFNGCYISTVNYIRAGQASGHQITWNSPVHIVTYYRYLRLFRDGAAVSLLTTEEPAHVVPHLTREALALHRGGAAPHLPSAVVGQAALKGRWRLEGCVSVGVGVGVGVGGDGDGDGDGVVGVGVGGDVSATAEGGEKMKTKTKTTTSSSVNLADAEGGLSIETEGVGKYIYRMDLALRSAGTKGGGGARNNKLVWKGFWSYNKLTDDWAEFTLKNDKPFFFSRVKSYGLGS